MYRPIAVLAAFILVVGACSSGSEEDAPLASLVSLVPISNAGAAEVYGVVAGDLLSAAEEDRKECEAGIPASGLAQNTTPPPECSGYLSDRPIVYVVDHPVNDPDMTLGWCDGDEFPEVCDRELTIVHTVAFGPEIRDSIALALAATNQLEFVDSMEAVTEPAEGIIQYGVINDGGLLRFGPIYSDGSASYLGVKCDPCQGFNFAFLRIEETPSGWLIDSEFSYII